MTLPREDRVDWIDKNMYGIAKGLTFISKVLFVSMIKYSRKCSSHSHLIMAKDMCAY